MDRIIVVTVLHGVEVKYDTEKKQFFAHVGGREIRKTSQNAVEQFIARFSRGTGRVKGILLDFGWRRVTVEQIEILGLRGSKIQHKRGDYIESENADAIYVYDEKLLAAAQALKKTYDDWLKEWEALLAKAKNIDPDMVR